MDMTKGNESSGNRNLKTRQVGGIVPAPGWSEASPKLCEGLTGGLTASSPVDNVIVGYIRKPDTPRPSPGEESALPRRERGGAPRIVDVRKVHIRTRTSATSDTEKNRASETSGKTPPTPRLFQPLLMREEDNTGRGPEGEEEGEDPMETTIRYQEGTSAEPSEDAGMDSDTSGIGPKGQKRGRVCPTTQGHIGLVHETLNQTQMNLNEINLEDPEFWELDESPGKRYPKKSKMAVSKAEAALTAKQREMVSSKTALFDLSSSAEIAVEAMRVLDKAELARFKTRTIRGDLNNHIKCGIQIAKKAIEVLTQRALGGGDKELSKDRFLLLMQEKEELKREIEILKKKPTMKSPKYTRAVAVGTSPVFPERKTTEKPLSFLEQIATRE